MARERAVHERGGADGAESRDGGRRLLDRRSYLGLAGATVTCVAGVGAAGTASAETRDEGTDDTESTAINDVLTIAGVGAVANYEFTVDGDLAANPEKGDLQQWDNVSDATATGWVTTADHVDSYRFSGSITDFTFLQGEARILLNGTKVTADSVVSGSALPRTVTFRGTGTAANYEFAVDGDLTANPEKGDLQQWDNVSDATATGWVTTADHVDSYRFSGSITDFTFLQGNCDVIVDGESVDPRAL